jgi:HTH-type transcriptional regulator / antitoxin HigA
MLIAPEEARNVARVLGECGVRLVFVEALPRGKVDGACYWLDKDKPVISMPFRYDGVDNFWFVLRHEIEHVLRRGGMDGFILDHDIEGEQDGLPEHERIANEAAADFVVGRRSARQHYETDREVLQVPRSRNAQLRAATGPASGGSRVPRRPVGG